MPFANLSERDPVMVRLAQSVGSLLAGTCLTGPEAVIEQHFPDRLGDENNASFLHEFDRVVFCCTVCDYWFTQIENANPGYNHDRPWMCRECAHEK